jgi:hypothetical protein
MSTFTKNLKYKKHPKLKNKYLTLESFIFYLNDDMTGEYLFVPKGTIFNGASFPKIVQRIFKFDPMDERWLQATVVHDVLVGEHKGKLRVSPTGRELSWEESTHWFDQALKVKLEHTNNTPPFNRCLFVKSVEFYGKIKNKKCWILG